MSQVRETKSNQITRTKKCVRNLMMGCTLYCLGKFAIFLNPGVVWVVEKINPHTVGYPVANSAVGWVVVATVGVLLVLLLKGLGLLKNAVTKYVWGE